MKLVASKRRLTKKLDDNIYFCAVYPGGTGIMSLRFDLIRGRWLLLAGSTDMLESRKLQEVPFVLLTEPAE